MTPYKNPDGYVQAVLAVLLAAAPGALDGLIVYIPADLGRAVRQALDYIQARHQADLDNMHRQIAARDERIRQMAATILWLQESLEKKTSRKNQL